jgi:hypothetical protein
LLVVFTDWKIKEVMLGAYALTLTLSQRERECS